MNEQITLTEKTLDHLESTRKWTLFMSMFGFLVIGLMILFAFTYQSIANDMSSSTSEPSAAFDLILMLSLTAAYLLPILYLYLFSTRMKLAIGSRDESLMESSFKALRLHYTFLSILIILVIAIYLVAGIIFGITGMAKI